MRHLDLFSGIGGFALSASWVWGPEHEIVSFCEIEPYCQKVLKKHWSAVPCHDDIKTLQNLIQRLRNSIAHFNINVISDDDVM